MKKIIIILGTILLAVAIVGTNINGSTNSLKSGSDTISTKGSTSINGL